MATRARSKVPQFRVRVPSTVVDRLRGKQVLLYLSENAGPPFIATPKIADDVAFSLGTKDAVVAASRQNAALDHLRRLFEMTAMEPVTISHKDLVALSGEVYRAYVALNEADPGEPIEWRYHKALHRAVIEGRIASPPVAILRAVDALTATELFGTGDLTEAVDALPAGQHDGFEDRFGLLADWILIRHRVNLVPHDRKRFLRLIGTASLDAGWQLKRNSEGDYSPDPKAERFPPLDTVEVIRPRMTFADLVSGWAKEAKSRGLSDRTINELYPQAIERLKAYLKHDNPAKITEDDILAYKVKRQETVTAKTWKDADLPPIKAIFGWAVKNRKLPFNPATSVSGERVKKIQSRPPDFSDHEAAAIFTATVTYQGGEKESSKTAAAKKWVPILLAYTGARLGEITQLRKQDVCKEDIYHIIKLLPEAGTIKGGQFRIVPLHEHLIELGFLQFVKESAQGALFVNSDDTGNATGLKGVNKRLTSFVRSIVTDPAVQPNHGWRHRFKSVCTDLGIAERVIDKIQGHVSTRNASGGYGTVTLRAMAMAMAQIPRVNLEKAGTTDAAPAVCERD